MPSLQSSHITTREALQCRVEVSISVDALPGAEAPRDPGLPVPYPGRKKEGGWFTAEVPCPGGCELGYK